MRQQHRRRFRTRSWHIIPARTHVLTDQGRPSPMITLDDRLRFRERVHIGAPVRFLDMGLKGSDFGEMHPRNGVIVEMHPHVVIVQAEAYKTAFTYDEIMMHDNVYLVGDDDYRIIRRAGAAGGEK